jgi:hypothetical protein
MSGSDIDFGDIDLTDSKAFVPRVPHEWFSFLRKNALSGGTKKPTGPDSGP